MQQQQQQSYQQQDATVGAQSAATTAVNIDQPSDQHPFPPQSIATLPPPSYHTESSEGYGGYGDPVTIGKMSAKRFQRVGKFRDPWMALLFLAHFVAFIIISILSFINTPAYTFRPGRRDGDGSVDQGSGGRGAVRLYSYTSVIIMSIITVVPFVLSMIFVVLLHRVPAQAIKLSVIVSLVLVLAASIYFFVKEIWWAGIVMLISALCYAMFWFFARKRIELTTLIVQAVSRVVRAYPGVMFVAIAATVVQTLYTAWWLMTLVAMTGWLRNEERCKDYRDPLTGQVYQSCSNGPATGLGIYLFISLYWTTQVIVNVVHTTISGVFATHYFFGGGFGEMLTTGHLNRALTTSFGSVCLGSLVVAIIQLIRALIRSVFSTDGSQPGFCTTVFRCIFDCLLAPIEALALIFNRYAFVTIAIYGTPFVASAKRTWRLLKARGVDGVINDSLVNSLMFLGCVVIAAITAAIGAIMVLVMNPWFNLGGNFTGVFIVLAFAVGGGVAGITTSVVGSGAAALFVCLSEQPEIMAITQPQLFDKIVAAYPAVVSRID
ncbi:DUF580-domain-containing protein [Ramicandelaber brevisporus]|nr:DUF580-domain-containing protein [Ramicandelaber brevisporus]